MKIHVTPLVSLADQKIEISVSGLQTGGRVTLRASMRLPWTKTALFESMAEFIADENGCVDLEKQAPVSDDYLTAGSMGLITSMKLVSGKLNEVGANISVDSSIFIDITAEYRAEKADVKIERLFMSPGVKTEMITEPFVGAFFYSENPNNKTVLLLGGSSGKLCFTLPYASLLASHGFNVLNVAYFSEPGLPKELVGIPLEYFDGVFDWLAGNQYTKGKDLYLHCMSKGGELGLLLASMHPSIKKVAAIAPHAYCFQGTSFTKTSSSWNLHGKPLPYIPMKISGLVGNMIDCVIKNKPFGYAQTYVKGLEKASIETKANARIRVENAKADLLLFSSKQNNMWNTYDGCVEIVNALNKADYPYKVEHITYETAGEPFYAPYILPYEVYCPIKIAPRLTFVSGGTPQGNTEAQIDSWEKMLCFFSSEKQR